MAQLVGVRLLRPLIFRELCQQPEHSQSDTVVQYSTKTHGIFQKTTQEEALDISGDRKWPSNLHIYKKFDKFTSKYMFNMFFATSNPVSKYKKSIRNRFRTMPSRWHNTIEYTKHPSAELWDLPMFSKTSRWHNR